MCAVSRFERIRTMLCEVRRTLACIKLMWNYADWWTVGLCFDPTVKALNCPNTIQQWAENVCCVSEFGCMCCRALLQCYVDSHEKTPAVSETAISALRYVQKNVPKYYKKLFALIVSSNVYSCTALIRASFCWFCVIYSLMAEYSMLLSCFWQFAFHFLLITDMAFYPRDAMLARVIVIATCLSVRLSVRLSVCPSRAGIVSKRRKLAAWFLHHLVAPRL